VDTKPYDIAIIGGGPAGLTAALYAGRSRVNTVLLEAKSAGGQLLNTEVLEDYPGFKRVDGHELAGYMVEQATHFGADVVEYNPVLRVRVQPDGTKLIDTENGDVYSAPAVIVTAGGNPRKLEVPGEVEYAGRGVSYCAVCDGAFFVGEHLAVIGGGDAAVEEALFLTRYATRVSIIHRRDAFRAQPILVHEAREHEKVELVMDTVVTTAVGDATTATLAAVKWMEERAKGNPDPFLPMVAASRPAV
jgi:thioredoxin reductase (NADPH)